VEMGNGNVSIIPAHSSALRALELSPNGEILASASETGTLIRIFSTANCARLGELRRGVDPATIFSLAISPGNTLLAVTSDKSTLHVFELPHPNIAGPASTTKIANLSGSTGSLVAAASADEATRNKWGLLGKLPLMPRVFSDIYSIASVHFEIGEEPEPSGPPGRATSPAISTATTGYPGGRPPKGIIGWTADDTIIVVGAGLDGRWEKFVMYDIEGGKKTLVRDGWKRYLGDSH
jgi:WD repeat-containing protein 45